MNSCPFFRTLEKHLPFPKTNNKYLQSKDRKTERIFPNAVSCLPKRRLEKLNLRFNFFFRRFNSTVLSYLIFKGLKKFVSELQEFLVAKPIVHSMYWATLKFAALRFKPAKNLLLKLYRKPIRWNSLRDSSCLFL